MGQQLTRGHAIGAKQIEAALERRLVSRDSEQARGGRKGLGGRRYGPANQDKGRKRREGVWPEAVRQDARAEEGKRCNRGTGHIFTAGP
jgi:hypothetical protein